ncbi:MAG TPA: hypothetical protein VIC33_12080 [Vicinamibacterales bacterium]|jgi:hypothetical protein
MNSMLEHTGTGEVITAGARRRDEVRHGVHVLPFRPVDPGESRADQSACCFVATLATHPSRRRLAIGRTVNGEPIPAMSELSASSRCTSEPTRFTRIRNRAAGSRRRAVLAVHALLARR